MKDCPLCKQTIEDKMYLFVKYVLSSEENVCDYMNGKLTYEVWEKLTLDALGVNKN